ncbi:MAG: helix-turn-helix transcriptional regulator [Bacteroidales bacterium]|jgi:transcriptional regulator with XRE-family HTH domain|nr:helix-turn-helix transcriptional regulator [Bacteroidales bacterium]
MDIRDVLGRNMFRFRKKLGLSQEALADRAGVGRGHIGAIERGEQNITVLTLWHVAEALGVEAADLLDEEQAARVERPKSNKSR